MSKNVSKCASRHYQSGESFGLRRRYACASMPAPHDDSRIAAIAKVHGLTLTLATGNTADFQATSISLVNPWEHGT